MKIKDAIQLKKGQEVLHNRYNECIVKEVMFACGELFGVVITPTIEEGKAWLKFDSGTDIPDFLEDSARPLRLV